MLAWAAYSVASDVPSEATEFVRRCHSPMSLVLRRDNLVQLGVRSILVSARGGPSQQGGGCGGCPPNIPSSRRWCGALAHLASL